MDLTPEERIIRDYYLSKRSDGLASSAYEISVCAISIGAFAYGLLIADDGSPMMVVGYLLGIAAVVRSIYSYFVYTPAIRTLLQKYEYALADKPNKAPEPTP